MRGNGHKVKRMKYYLNVKIPLSSVRGVEHWNSLFREVVEFSSKPYSKISLDMSNLL